MYLQVQPFLSSVNCNIHFISREDVGESYDMIYLHVHFCGHIIPIIDEQLGRSPPDGQVTLSNVFLKHWS